ncbi:MAG: dihydrofolate reductase [Ignavibacteriaceae bacterium]|nr:dihydrofolate reductase [Ignavibacteriaceae bacterium]
MKISIIVAVAKNNVIGKASGEMPWHIKEEFQHFKKTTFGHTVIMGRKTFETLGKTLKGRQNIIVSRNVSYSVSFSDVLIFNSLDNAIEYCREKSEKQIFIIGGGEIYRQAISFADEMIISRMKFEAEGEVKFPEFNKNIWKVVSTEDHEQFEVFRYERIK